MGELHLVHGTDEPLVGQAVVELSRRLVGSGDRALLVADLTVDGEEVTVGRVIAEAQTPPFLTDKRVVVARGVERVDADGLAQLQGYLAEPLDTTDLVLVHQGRPTKRLLDVVKAAGGTVAGVDVGSNRRDRAGFVAEQVAAAGLRLDQAALGLLTDHLGEDLNRLAGLLEMLGATYGTSTGRVGVDDLVPYLGDGGGVPPWDLTDAIDRGDRAAALDALDRMSRAGARHPLQIMAILHTHYTRLLRLDGSGAGDQVAAEAVLGVKGFAAKKAFERSRAMGPEAIHEAVQLLARADLDLRGQRELPEDAVLQVLVARLCRLSGRRRPASAGRR
jgi:DNA polymerase III subunit delta